MSPPIFSLGRPRSESMPDAAVLLQRFRFETLCLTAANTLSLSGESGMKRSAAIMAIHTDAEAPTASEQDFEKGFDKDFEQDVSATQRYADVPRLKGITRSYSRAQVGDKHV